MPPASQVNGSFPQNFEGILASCIRLRAWVQKGPPQPPVQPLSYKFPCTISPGRSFGKRAVAWHNTSLPSLPEIVCVGEREMTDASIPRTHGCRPSIKNTKDQDARGQSSAHASGWSPFHSFFVYFDRSTPSMKPGGHLWRIRLDFQFENLCDRSEDRFASVVSLLSILFGQPACPSTQSRDPTGLQLILCGYPFFQWDHFSISSS